MGELRQRLSCRPLQLGGRIKSLVNLGLLLPRFSQGG